MLSALEHCPHYRLKDALSEPKPVQSPSIHLWVGGMGERRTLREVAEVADGWNTFLMPEEEYRQRGRFLATTPERCAEVLKPFRDLGVGDFLMLARPPADDRTIELFATQVAPALRA